MKYCAVRLAAFAFLFTSAARADDALPYYDIRLDSEGLPTVVVQQAKLNATAAPAINARQTEVLTLHQQIPSLRIDAHEFFGTPHFIRSTEQLLTVGQGEAPRVVARRFVAAHPSLFEISPTELDAARMDRDFVTRHNGVTHLTFQQQIKGADLFGCEVLANVDCNGALINIGSSMLPRPAGDFQTVAPTITALQAVRAAAANVGIKMKSNPTAKVLQAGSTRKQIWQNTADFRPEEPITTELVYFPLTRNDIRPAWSVLIPKIGVGDTFEIMIDATNGQVLRRMNRLKYASTEPITFRVYTGDNPAPGSPGTNTPTGFQFPFVPQQVVTINPAAIIAINPNGWVDDGVNETLGNNVDAHLDRDGSPNSPDLPRPSGVTYRNFDYTHDPAQSPLVAGNQNAAVTQLFYLANVYHDRLWAMGFDEPAKNFQTNNFGRGGTGNDPVRADAQDGSGTNNANFNTGGSDGSTGRCQMYIFDRPTPNRDGDLDGDIVFHELSHGLSIRLSNGTVNGTQSGGMGEGWGDYFGISLLAQAADDPHAVYATGAYATLSFFGAGYVNNYYFGIRRYPYSTDMNKNPMTYADTATAQFSVPDNVPANSNTNPASEVHNVGEIWCSTLLECRANMWDISGFAANQTLMQLVVDGLKLEASNPNFLQARDGILQADLVNNASANHGAIWRAFAKRGMGPLATSPSGSSSVGVAESFKLLQFTYPSGTPAQLQPGVATPFSVAVAGIAAGITPTPATGQILYSVNGGAFIQVAMTQISANNYTATLPALQCFDVVRYYVSSDSNVGVITDAIDAPATTFSASVFQSTSPTFADDAEINRGWTIGAAGDTATTGIWVRGDPVGTNAQPENAHSPVNCYFTGQGSVGGADGTNDVDNGATTLTSPIADISAANVARVSYWRWFSNDVGSAPNTDTFRVDATGNNGGSWTNMETIGAAFGGEHSGGWFFHEFEVPAALKTSQFRVRFVADDAVANGGSVYEAAIDDFNVSVADCTNVVTCTHGDVNGDLTVNGQDISRFVQILLSGGGTPTENCAGDLSASPNGAIDPADVGNFVSCVLAGGC